LRGAVGRGSGGSRRTVERSFPTCVAILGYPSHFTVHFVPLPVPYLSCTTPLCTGVAFHAARSSLGHPSGSTSCDVHQHLSPWATYGRGAIAQRVGTGLRPGKLRKKGLDKGNKDGQLTRAMLQVGRIRQVSLFSVERGASNPAEGASWLRKFMG
jgi:hypothetical protein